MTTSRTAVVITCFNIGRTLDEALQSVRAQTRPAADVVVVDDGSTDPYTRQVLARLAREGVRVFRTPNRGVSAARNAGARATDAPSLVFLDADDQLAPTYLEISSTQLDDDDGLGFVSCQMRSFGANQETWTPPDPDLIASLTFGVVHVSSLMRRSVWEDVGGFDETFPAQEDLDFWTRVVAHGVKGRVLQEPLFSYRVRPHSNYSRALEPGLHRTLMARFYEKHLEILAPRAVDLLVAKERFLLDQREHHSSLLYQRDALREEARQISHAIADVTRRLEGVGLRAVDMGDLRRTSPISPVWGTDRGLPLDRHYIHGFLERHRLDVRGRVLEIKDRGYTNAYGEGRVESSDVLDVDPENDDATIIADLTRAVGIDDDTYDCIILTQTLGLIRDVAAAISEVHRILRPGGVVLCTVPAAGRISCEGAELDADFWRFTEASMRHLFSLSFPLDAFEVTGFGNVLACSAFLYGMTPDELTVEELDTNDPYFPLVYGIRAVKPYAHEEGTRIATNSAASTSAGAAVLMYHRMEDRASFSSHLHALRREGYEVLALPALVEAVRRKGVRRPTVALTFDDGYVDSLEVVVPALAEHAWPATFFVVGAALDQRCEFWWDLLRRIFRPGRALPAECHLDDLIPGLVLTMKTDGERRLAHARLTEHFYTLPLALVAQLQERLLEWSGLAPERSSLLTAEQLASLESTRGMDIGAHSLHHVWLPTQTPDVRRAEIFESRLRLTTLLRRPVTSFAYPYGGHDGCVDLVREAGFTYAVTTEERVVTQPVDPWRLPRIDVGNLDADLLVARCEAFWQRT